MNGIYRCKLFPFFISSSCSSTTTTFLSFHFHQLVKKKKVFYLLFLKTIKIWKKIFLTRRYCFTKVTLFLETTHDDRIVIYSLLTTTYLEEGIFLTNWLLLSSEFWDFLASPLYSIGKKIFSSWFQLNFIKTEHVDVISMAIFTNQTQYL